MDRKNPRMIETPSFLFLFHSWIGEVIESRIDKSRVPKDPLILHLNVGDCDELLYTESIFRNYNPNIVAVDLKEPTQHLVWRMTPRDIIMFTGAHFEIADIRDIDRVISICGRIPDIVISRHPKMFERDAKRTVHEWWGDVLAEYGKLVSSNKGQMLITTMVGDERDFLTNVFQKKQVSHVIGKNDFAPRQVVRHLADGQIAIPDSYTLKVG